MNILTLNHVYYQYPGTDRFTLQDITASFEKGKIYAVIGASGAGKTTLLSLIAGLDAATDGEVLFYDKDLKYADRDNYRSKEIGVIFQSYNLLKNANALENVLLSMNISGIRGGDLRNKANEFLEKVGIVYPDTTRKILKLSGGEQQRVAIARALSHDPEIIIADEPTGNLDKENQARVVNILQNLAHKEDRCVIMVTHSSKVASFADEVYKISKGRLFTGKNS